MPSDAIPEITVEITQQRKSLPKGLTFSLPGFSIISGLNGSGKSQLLTGIAEGNDITVFRPSKSFVKLSRSEMRYTPSHFFLPTRSRTIGELELHGQIEHIWGRFNDYKRRYKDKVPTNLVGFPGDGAAQVREMSKLLGKDIEDLIEEDFYLCYPLVEAFKIDLFEENLTNLFTRYHKAWVHNKFLHFRHSEGENVTCLSQDQFDKMYGEPPWNMVNAIMDEMEMEYHFNFPTGLNADKPFNLVLVHKTTGLKIRTEDLSSGENSILGLVIAIYNLSASVLPPKLLLLDEPDVHLHPSLTKKFLSVLENIFVKKRMMAIILTTHSPSTVALSDERYLYLMSKDGERLRKASKDEALRNLLAGVPSLSINYENRRQVFVEGQNDVSYYEKLYRIIGSYLVPDISLSFISSGESRTDKNGLPVSGCDQVRNIVNKLREYGNNLIFGVIDSDGMNSSTDYIKVLGEGNRYSIENYIFDPLILAGLLLREKLIGKPELGLSDEEFYTDLKRFSEDRLQFVADAIIDKLKQIITPINTDKKGCKLVNDYLIHLPLWFLNYNGHELEEKIIQAFPGLVKIKQNKEERLKLEIIDKVIDDMPGLLSRDVLELFSHIQGF